MIKIILCALNEAKNLEILLPSIVNCLQKIGKQYEISLCIDGSFDQSYNLILDFQKKYPINVLPVLNQRGLGLAYKRLFLDGLKNDDDLLISLDADNTHDPAQLELAIKYFYDNDLDLLILSRFCAGSMSVGFPLYRRFISKMTSLFLQNIFRIKKISQKLVQDYSSGYRIYRVEALRNLYKKYGENFIIEKDFIYTCEILIKMGRLGARIDELALNYNYANKIGVSKLKITKNFFGLVLMIFRLKIRFWL